MQKKAQTMGTFLLGFVAVIVAIALFIAAAQNIGSATNTMAVTEIDLGAITNETAIYLTDYRALSDVTIQNGTSAGLAVGSTNWTLTNNVIDPTTGELSVRIVPDEITGYYGAAIHWFLNGTAQPQGYIDTSAGRSIAGLILIFAALAIAVIIITMSNEGLRNLFKDKMGR